MSIGISLQWRARSTPGLNPTVPASSNRLSQPRCPPASAARRGKPVGAVNQLARSGPTSWPDPYHSLRPSLSRSRSARFEHTPHAGPDKGQRVYSRHRAPSGRPRKRACSWRTIVTTAVTRPRPCGRASRTKHMSCESRMRWRATHSHLTINGSRVTGSNPVIPRRIRRAGKIPFTFCDGPGCLPRAIPHANPAPLRHPTTPDRALPSRKALHCTAVAGLATTTGSPTGRTDPPQPGAGLTAHGAVRPSQVAMAHKIRIVYFSSLLRGRRGTIVRADLPIIVSVAEPQLGRWRPAPMASRP